VIPHRAALLTLVVGIAGCEKCGAPSPSSSSSSSEPGEEAGVANVGGSASASGGRHGSRADEPKAEAAWLDASVDAACTGPTIDLVVAMSDPRCGTTSTIAKALRAALEADGGGGAPALRQRARRVEDGSVELSIVNGGRAPIALPLSHHPKIASFVVLASEPTAKAVFELEAPALPLRPVGAGGIDAGARFVRIILPPAGVASVRIAIDTKVVRRVDPTKQADTDAGPAPLRLPAGRWTLHVGQLLTDVETGEPATISWDVSP
jgi:hypothetical protein